MNQDTCIRPLKIVLHYEYDLHSFHVMFIILILHLTLLPITKSNEGSSINDNENKLNSYKSIMDLHIYLHVK